MSFSNATIVWVLSFADLVQHYLLEAFAALHRVHKSGSNCISRATGATIVNCIEGLHDSGVGTKCGMFHIENLGDE